MNERKPSVTYNLLFVKIWSVSVDKKNLRSSSKHLPEDKREPSKIRANRFNEQLPNETAGLEKRSAGAMVLMGGVRGDK